MNMAEAAEIAGLPAPAGVARSRTEFAVSVVNPAPLAGIGADEASRRAHWLATLDDPELAEWIACFVPTHLYVGSEFCEHLLPGTPALKRAIVHAREADCRLALLTPIASPQVIRVLGELLPRLPEGSEVIANDWGVAHLVRRRFPALRLVAGRILCRMVKDPRLAQIGLTAGFRFDPGPLRTLFDRLGIGRMEIDVPMFVDGDTFAALPMPTGVHVPFACVAKGRMCRIGSTSIRGPERFAVGRECRRECLKVASRLDRPGSDGTSRVYQIGNSIFSRHSRETLDAVRRAVEQGFIGRLVVPGEAP